MSQSPSPLWVVTLTLRTNKDISLTVRASDRDTAIARALKRRKLDRADVAVILAELV